MIIGIDLGKAVMIAGMSVIWSSTGVIRVLMATEVLLLAGALESMSGSLVWDDMMGNVYTLYVLIIAAGEASIGLAMLVVYSKVSRVATKQRVYVRRSV